MTRSTYGLERLDRVDPDPEQVRRVEVEPEAELEHPLPELGRVGEVAGIAVGVPALHHAVLDHQPHPALARVVDQRRQHPLGLAQVVGDAERVVAADEGADRDAAEGRGRVDAGAQVGVDRLALGRVGVQVVVVVGERRELEAVVRRARARTRSASASSNSSAARWRATNGRSPSRGQAASSSASKPCAPAQAATSSSERSGMQALSRPSFTSPPQPSSRLRADSSTASVIRTARRPSASVGSPSARASPRDRRVGLGDEGVEAVLDSPADGRRAGSRRRPPRRSGCRSRAGSARCRSGGRPRGSRAAPGRSRRRPRCPPSLEPEMVLAPRRDLRDHGRADDARRRSRTSPSRCPRSRPRAGRRRRRRARTSAPRAAARSACATAVRARERDDPLAGDELDQVAPVRADVGERPRGAAELGLDAPVVVGRREQPVLEVAAVQQPQLAERAGAGARAGLAHGRVVAVDERHRRDAAGGSAAARPARRRRRRRAPAASRRPRACRPRAPRGPAAGGGGWGCRCGRRRSSSEAISSSALAKPRSAPSSARAPRARSGEEAATPAMPRAGEPRGAGVDAADEAGADDARARSSVRPSGAADDCGLDRDGASLSSMPRTYSTYVGLSSKSFAAEHAEVSDSRATQRIFCLLDKQNRG